MTIDPKTAANQKEVHDLLLGTVSPRPIALASTVDCNGNINLSPFSFFNIFSTRPVILVFSPSRRQRDKTTKHTLENILETHEVVINTVNHAMVEQVSLASSEFMKGVNEFAKAGFTEVKSERVKPPRVKQSPASFECRVMEVKSMGTEGGSGNLVICEVVLIHVQDFILNYEGKIDPRKVDSVARMGADFYCRVNGDNIFELPKPKFPVGIGIDQLPDSIRNSSVLTGNNLGRLAGVDKIPTTDEVNSFSESFDYNRLWRGTENNRLTAVHRHAQSLVEKGEVKKAWLLLLSVTNKVNDGVE
jgi:flavin reductase (DIM6/NTAB) family NADH-FMN oxidoreductase RutF